MDQPLGKVGETMKTALTYWLWLVTALVTGWASVASGPAAGQNPSGQEMLGLDAGERICVSVAVADELRRQMDAGNERRLRRDLARTAVESIREVMARRGIATTLDAGAARVVGRLDLCSRAGDMAVTLRVSSLPSEQDGRPAYRIAARVFQGDREMTGHFDRAGFFHAEAAGPGGFARRLRRSIEKDLKDEAADIAAAVLPPDAS